nr:hypothetical protein CFP56_19662 [Quercus suber]
MSNVGSLCARSEHTLAWRHDDGAKDVLTIELEMKSAYLHPVTSFSRADPMRSSCPCARYPRTYINKVASSPQESWGTAGFWHEICDFTLSAVTYFTITLRNISSIGLAVLGIRATIDSPLALLRLMRTCRLHATKAHPYYIHSIGPL